MKATDPLLPSNPQAWVSYAEEDFRAMQAIAAAAEPSCGVICFLAQQTAEKYLKAFLVRSSVEPTRTHDLVKLQAQCEVLDQSLSTFTRNCTQLNPYSAPPRYPSGLRLPTETEAKAAIAAAQQIRNEIRQRLGL